MPQQSSSSCYLHLKGRCNAPLKLKDVSVRRIWIITLIGIGFLIVITAACYMQKAYKWYCP